MGAETFGTSAWGTTADEAFRTAQEEARYEHGNGGYTGTIAEKYEYVFAGVLPEGVKATDVYAAFAYGVTDDRPELLSLVETWEERFDDKWGPAVCFRSPKPNSKGDKHLYHFMGWASS